MTRGSRPSSWTALCARLTLAAFAAALPGPAAWAQAVERAAPVSVPAAGFALAGALASPFSPPSILEPSALSAAPLFNAAPAPTAAAALPAALQAASMPASMSAASASLPAASAPAAGAALRSMSAPSAAMSAPDADADGARALAAATFDAAAAPSNSGASLLLEAPTAENAPSFEGPSGRKYRLVPGTKDLVSDEAGTYYRLSVNKNGGLAVESLLPEPSQKPEVKKEVPGLTDELLENLVGTLHLVDQSFVEKLSTDQWKKLIDKGMNAILEGLEEPHTHYFDKEGWQKYRHQADGNFTGIGIVIDTSVEKDAFVKALDEAKAKAGSPDEDAVEKLAENIPFTVHQDGARIKSVGKGSPAEAAGLQSGDVVVRIDGLDVGGKLFGDVTQKIQGPVGSVAQITVSRGGRLIELTATRAEVETPLMSAAVIAPGIGYLYYREFRADSEEEFVRMILRLQSEGAKKLIIDLRGNPGGNIRTANNLMANLLPGGLQLSYNKHRGETSSDAQTGQDGHFAAMEKIVLIDGHSASSSEMMAATLQDYGVTVVGPSKSYGKFSFQNVLPLPRGKTAAEAETGMKITAGRFYSGKGRSFPGQFDPKTEHNIPGTGGVTPDVIVPMTKDQEQEVRVATHERLYGGEPKSVADPVLDKAVEILQSRP